MKCIAVATFLFFAAASFAQSVIPNGTILPVKLNSSLNSKKGKVRQEINGTLAQDVPLASGSKIRAGAKLVGHILAVAGDDKATGATLAFRFDTLETAGRSISLTTDLRAIASMMEVHDAQLPKSGPDRGTSEIAWATQQVGNEVVYHGGWSVTNGPEVSGSRCYPVASWRRSGLTRGPHAAANSTTTINPKLFGYSRRMHAEATVSRT